MTWLVDAGPLVAYLSPRDEHHAWAVACFKAAHPPLLTCEAALSEACFLASRDGRNPSAPVALVERGLVRVAFDVQGRAGAVGDLMRKYADRPMSLADACLVLLSEQHAGTRLLTTDQQDFTIYRRADGASVPAVFPTEWPAR